MQDNHIEYPLFKGLQRPLEFMGIQGRYIYWAAAAVGGALVGFIVAYCLLGFVAGLITMVVCLGGGAGLVLVKQQKGLHTKKTQKGVFVYHHAKGLSLLAPVLMLQGCAHSAMENRPVAAQTAEDTRSAWEKSVKPIAVVVENAPEGLSEIGVWATIKDGTPEEATAFAGAVFKRKGDFWLSENPHAVTSDTMAVAEVCWPRSAARSISLTAPFGERLSGRLVADSVGGSYACVKSFRMASSMAVIQIVTESGNRHDLLDGLKVYGDGLPVSGVLAPYSGRWSELTYGGYLEAMDADCLMANGREHEIYVPHTTEACDVTVFAKVNGKELAFKTTLPPMAAGSLTRLNLRKEGLSMKITGSWVATQRPLKVSKVNAVDTVKCGHYLRKDGYVVATKDADCLAMVIETDGKHGKAVAFADCEGEYSFGAVSGQSFPTIDGIRTEGKINPTRSENVADDARIVYEPKMSWPRGCALGYNDGASLTDALLKDFRVPSEETALAIKPMLMEVQRHPASYIPSLAEIAQFYYLCNPLKGRYYWIEDIEPLSGTYLTSTEPSPSSLYLFDFANGVVTGTSSKAYTKSKLRLFYLF